MWPQQGRSLLRGARLGVGRGPFSQYFSSAGVVAM